MQQVTDWLESGDTFTTDCGSICVETHAQCPSIADYNRRDRIGREYHRENWSSSFVRYVHGPSPQIGRAVRKTPDHGHAFR
jgi:hypothetical protein